VPTYAASFEDLLNAVSDKLRLDTDEDFTRAGLWINGAIAKIAIQTGYFHGSSLGTPLQTGDTSQGLPTSMVRLDYVVSGTSGQERVLAEAVSFEQVLHLRYERGSTGVPRIYYLWQGLCEFWPTAIGGETLNYFGSILPDTITAFDLCPIPEPFSKLVEYGACFEAALYKKDPLVEEYRSLYSEWLGHFRAYLNQRRGRKGLQFDLKVMESESYIPHDPSTDLLTWP
jgi:hypothetical protein